MRADPDVDWAADVAGTFGVDAVTAALDEQPRSRLLALTGASNVTGWVPPIDEIIEAAHDRGVPVLVDAAQFAPHRPLPCDADYLGWGGHKERDGPGAPVSCHGGGEAAAFVAVEADRGHADLDADDGRGVMARRPRTP